MSKLLKCPTDCNDNCRNCANFDDEKERIYQKGVTDTINKMKQESSIALGYIAGELLRRQTYPKTIYKYYSKGVIDFVGEVNKIITKQLEEQ